ncbi:MAG: DUF2070 family protein [Candidatus Bathyarchaeia archaeon]
MSEENYLRVKGTTPYYNLVRRISFPSLRTVLLLLFCVNVAGAALAYLIATPSPRSVAAGAVFGLLGAAAPTLLSDAAAGGALLKGDRLFTLRRRLSLSLFSSMVWASSLVVGAAISRIYPPFSFPRDPFYLGLFFVLPLRSIAVYSISSAAAARRFSAALLQPLLTLLASIPILSLRPIPSILGFVIAGSIALLYSIWLTWHIERRGREKVGASPLSLFKGFLQVLLEGDNSDFENMLEKLGVEEELNISAIGFRRLSDKSLKSIVLVSDFHPGPFLNVGSSGLPHMVQAALERESGAVTAVPHGISGHEMNLVSHAQNERVIQEARRLTDFTRFKPWAGRLVTARRNQASASCQIFGGCPLVTLTLAPQDMEDIPQEAGEMLRRYAEEEFRHVALVDAHNSISRVTAVEKGAVNDLVEAAEEAISAAKKVQKSDFRHGVAKIDLSGYTLRDGVGPGGGQTLLFQVDGQTSAYLVFDANNMYRGVREMIRARLREMGVEESEVLTTDTHTVNGLVPAKLGYHPLGETLDLHDLMDRIVESVERAKLNLEPCEAASGSSRIRVKILGLALYRTLTDFLYRTIKLVVFSMLPLLVVTLLIFLTYLSKVP